MYLMSVGKQWLFSGFCYRRGKCRLCKADAVDFFVLGAVKPVYVGGGDESIQGMYLLSVLSLASPCWLY